MPYYQTQVAPKAPIGKFIQYYKPHLGLLTLDMTSALLLAGIDLIFPLFTKRFVNQFIPNKDLQSIIVFTGILVFLYTLRLGFSYIMGYWGHIMGTRMEYDMRRKLFAHIQTLPFRFFDETKTGQIMARLIGDLREIAELSHHGPEDLFISIIMILGSFFILLRINVLLTCIVFIFVVMLVVFAVWKRRDRNRTFREVRNRHATMNAQLEVSISGARLAKSFCNEDFEIDRFDCVNQDYKESWKEAYRMLATFSSGTAFFADLLNIAAMSVGGFFAYKGWITLGDLFAYLLYAAFTMQPIRRLMSFVQEYEVGFAGFNRFQEMMDVMPDIKDKPDAIELKNCQGKVEFRDVTFHYEETHGNILEHFNLTIPSGMNLALVGPSGAGKTTISNLIPRFYDVSSGSILVDNVDIRDYSLKSLRSQIGIVQQDLILFWGTIRDNILYGRPDATEEEMIQASIDANLHDFITSLPDRYDSFVGERGVKLSGGQKQRVAIARVFLKNPPILILDEATSSLDNQTELEIQKAIERLAVNRTTITIAHRLSTIRCANEIVVLTDEGISEIGTHETLLQSQGLYSKLYKAQYQGFIPDQI
jgi:ATP-binding cassette subfamily B protein